MNITEPEIIKALKDDDEKIFQIVFEEWYAPLCRYAHHMLNDTEEAEEMVQESFIYIWKKRQELEYNVSIKSYLYQSVKNKCLNRIKHLKVRALYADEYVATNKEAHIENTLVQKELGQKITDAMESLPGQCKIIFKMSRNEEMKYTEIASKLDISVKTVENQMGKALRIMRAKLSEYLVVLLIMYILIK